MSFADFVSNIYTWLGIGGLVLTCAFAWWKGGPPERIGTAMLAAVWVGADIARSLSGERIPTLLMFSSDALLAAGFLYVAVRYSSLWLGAVMIFQSIEFAVHATQMSDADAVRWHGYIVYLLINNVLNYVLLMTLTGGTVAAILRRGRQRREAAELEAKAAARKNSALRFTAPPLPPAAAI